jgi:phage terminase small subunit
MQTSTTKPKQLTAREKAFVAHYCRCLNQTKAARLAGYSEKSAYSIGYENLRKPHVQEAVRTEFQRMAMPSEEVLARLSAQAASNIGDFLKVDTDGDVFWVDLSVEKPLHLIKKLKITKSTLGDSDDAIIVDTKVEIELYDAQSALTTLAKHHGLLVERQEISGPGGRPIGVIPIREVVIERPVHEEP